MKPPRTPGKFVISCFCYFSIFQCDKGVILRPSFVKYSLTRLRYYTLQLTLFAELKTHPQVLSKLQSGPMKTKQGYCVTLNLKTRVTIRILNDNINKHIA
jgi:hypothetical protein